MRRHTVKHLCVPQKRGLEATGILAGMSKAAGFTSVSQLLVTNPNAKRPASANAKRPADAPADAPAAKVAACQVHTGGCCASAATCAGLQPRCGVPQAQKVVNKAEVKPKAEPAPKAPQRMDDAELPPRAPLVRHRLPCFSKCWCALSMPGLESEATLPRASERISELTSHQQHADAARYAQAGEALRVHRSNALGRRARGPAWPLEVGDDELLPAGCDAGKVLEVLEFLEVRRHRLAGPHPPALALGWAAWR